MIILWFTPLIGLYMVTEAHCGLLEHLTDSYKLPIDFKEGPALKNVQNLTWQDLTN